MNNLVAGLIAALPLSVVGTTYALIGEQRLSKVFQTNSPEMAEMPQGATRLMLLAMFGLGPLVLGFVAGLVYPVVDAPQLYLGLALSLAALMSIAALITRTPLMVDKIGMNFVVAATLGLLIPRLIGG